MQLPTERAIEILRSFAVVVIGGYRTEVGSKACGFGWKRALERLPIEKRRRSIERSSKGKSAQEREQLGIGCGPHVAAGRDPIEKLSAVRAVEFLGRVLQDIAGAKVKKGAVEMLLPPGVVVLRRGDLLLGGLHSPERRVDDVAESVSEKREKSPSAFLCGSDLLVASLFSCLRLFHDVLRFSLEGGIALSPGLEGDDVRKRRTSAQRGAVGVSGQAEVPGAF
jgi:hypothetical protein